MMTIGEDPRLDPERHRVRCGDEWRSLRPQPWLAFERLYARQGHVVRQAELAAAVWPAQVPASEHVVRQLVCDLRRQLRGTPFAVRTWPRIGYEIETATIFLFDLAAAE
jgi:DNA-binding winged helix-turn-helix (wHTH) protein